MIADIATMAFRAAAGIGTSYIVQDIIKHATSTTVIMTENIDGVTKVVDTLCITTTSTNKVVKILRLTSIPAGMVIGWKAGKWAQDAAGEMIDEMRSIPGFAESLTKNLEK